MKQQNSFSLRMINIVAIVTCVDIRICFCTLLLKIKFMFIKELFLSIMFPNRSYVFTCKENKEINFFCFFSFFFHLSLSVFYINDKMNIRVISPSNQLYFFFTSVLMYNVSFAHKAKMLLKIFIKSLIIESLKISYKNAFYFSCTLELLLVRISLSYSSFFFFFIWLDLFIHITAKQFK